MPRVRKENRMYLHIDGGTTNTRVTCSDGKHFSLCASSHVGAGNNAHLAEFVRETLAVNASEGDIILASGMIGSKLGLCEIPHLPTPAGISELHDGIRKVFLPDRIVNIEFATLFTVTVRFPRRNIRNVFYCFVRLLCL